MFLGRIRQQPSDQTPHTVGVMLLCVVCVWLHAPASVCVHVHVFMGETARGCEAAVLPMCQTSNQRSHELKSRRSTLSFYWQVRYKGFWGREKPIVIPVFQSLHNVCLFAFVIVMSFAARWGKVFERVGGEGFRVTGVKCLDWFWTSHLNATKH